MRAEEALRQRRALLLLACLDHRADTGGHRFHGKWLGQDRHAGSKLAVAHRSGHEAPADHFRPRSRQSAAVPETAWFNYSLSALRDEDGSVARPSRSPSHRRAERRRPSGSRRCARNGGRRHEEHGVGSQTAASDGFADRLRGRGGPAAPIASILAEAAPQGLRQRLPACGPPRRPAFPSVWVSAFANWRVYRPSGD
jgi:hypothetical protein